MRCKRAFTLVELLVVIGIIAVLISVLLPALNKARESAINTQCQSNLHQIWVATLLYAHDNKQRLVPASTSVTDSFDVLLDKYLKTLPPVGTPRTARGGLWACPGDEILRTDPNVSNPVRSYNINAYLSMDDRYKSRSIRLNKRVPQTIVVFGEYWSVSNGVRTRYGAAQWFTIFSVMKEVPLLGRYHFKRGGNYVSLDGSVRWISIGEMMGNPNLYGGRYWWED